MTVEQAINKLIGRNKSLVQKNGVSDYTRETDKIINVLLDYYHCQEKEKKDLRYKSEIADLLQKLFFGRVENLNIDFLKTMIEKDTEPYMCESEISVDDILRQNKFYNLFIESELQSWYFFKTIIPKLTHEQKKLLPKVYLIENKLEFLAEIKNQYYTIQK